ncbi:ran-binding protein 3-like isoform X2 [Littorina saxatilis]|uniref:ran-binding protein 3-like isoform X2 n=1 Tax=Littorina saxatilis TaxID=31220 RepID=UPI0038B5365C
MADTADSSRTAEADTNPEQAKDEAKTPVVSSTKEAEQGDKNEVSQSQPASSTTDAMSPHKNGSSPLVHPPKLGGFISSGGAVFGGASGISQPTFSNPFLPRMPLKTDVVSTASADTQSRSDRIIAPSRLNPLGAKSSDSECDSGDFGGKDLSASKFQMRPSALRPTDGSPFGASRSTVVSSSILRPAKLPDPRTSADVKEPTKESSQKDSTKVSSSAASQAEAGEVTSSTERDAESAPPAGASGGTENFAAELSKNNQLKEAVTTSVSSSSGFVFGQNISQRVTGVAEGEASVGATEEASSTSQPLVFGENLGGRAALTNGASAALPDNGYEENGDNEAQAAAPAARGGQTLEESAREYQAKHDNKVELDEVEVITGEEDESNVLQANGKLFVFDCDTQTWTERGRGTIRLNDMSPQNSNSNTFQSRLVMRTQGCLRVILNTKIWPGMNVERASTKAIRITATDVDQAVRVFLIMTNPKDLENLLRAIDWRIQQLKIHDDWEKVPDPLRHGEKRKADVEAESPPPTAPFKHKKMEAGVLGNLRKEESDSSVQDPETEASCESQASSLTVKSESD